MMDFKSPDPHITHFPSPIKKMPSFHERESKIVAIASCFQQIMEILGLDLSDDSLKETPLRIAEMYVNEIFSGLEADSFPEISAVENKGKSSSRTVLVKDITLMSFCEHHFIPMSGFAHVAYIPRKKIIGLSKINRIVRYFSSRPQLQERLTSQIADSLATLVETPDVAVYIDARHHCVAARGISDTSSSTITYALKGVFEENASFRAEFFQNIR